LLADVAFFHAAPEIPGAMLAICFCGLGGVL